MWPWGHLAVGYLLYSLWCRIGRRPPSGIGAIAVAFGTQFPDLVDKPISWTLALLPTGRSLTHSLVTATLLLGILHVGARRYDRRIPLGAFALGYLSHIAMDVVHPIMRGDFSAIRFLLWPFLPLPTHETPNSIGAHFTNLQLTPSILIQFALGVVALGVWIADGTPGLDELRHWWRVANRTQLEEQ